MKLFKLIKKEFLQLIRDRLIIIFLIYVFTIDIIVAGEGFGISLRNALFGIFDMDKTKYSRELVYKLLPPYFNVKKSINSWAELEKWIADPDTTGAVIIPEDFAEKIKEHKRSRALVVLDGSNISTSMLAYAYLSSIASSFNEELIRKELKVSKKEQPPSVDARIRILFNPNLENAYYTAFTELFMNITIMTIILSALTFVRERDYGTIEQILVSPVSFTTLVTSKVIFIILCMLVLCMLSIILVIYGYFKINVFSNILLFIILTVINIISNTGIGLIISGIARKMSQVGLLTMLFTAPMLFLSGGWVPPESMPSWLKPFTDISPLKYYLELSLSALLKGVSFTEAFSVILRFAAISFIIFLTGFSILNRRLKTE